MDPRSRQLNVPPIQQRSLIKRPESNTNNYTKSNQELENDRIIGRIKYLQQILFVFRQFQKTKNINLIKDFVVSNNLRFKMLLDQLYQLKEIDAKNTMDKGSMIPRSQDYYLRELEKVKKQNERLKKQYQMEKQKQEALRLKRETVIERTAGQQQIVNLQNTIVKLKNQIQELNKKNSKFIEVLSKKDFFKEYEFMCKQCDGIQKQNEKLKEYMKKKKQELNKIRLTK